MYIRTYTRVYVYVYIRVHAWNGVLRFNFAAMMDSSWSRKEKSFDWNQTRPSRVQRILLFVSLHGRIPSRFFPPPIAYPPFFHPSKLQGMEQDYHWYLWSTIRGVVHHSWNRWFIKRLGWTMVRIMFKKDRISQGFCFYEGVYEGRKIEVESFSFSLFF